MRYGLATGAMAAVLAFAAPASAEMPAVSGLNFKAEGFGGVLDEDYDAFGAAGSVAFPVIEQIGVQIDAMAGSVDSELAYGVGAHVFWRSPSIGMIGIAASYSDVEDLYDVQRYQVEAEYFFDSVTLGAHLGWQDVDVIDDAFFVGIDATVYFTDDFAVNAGVKGIGYDADEDVQFNLGAEFGIGSMVSFYADAKIGTESDIAALAGVRFSFGNRGQTVKDRHRLDDPANLVLDGLFMTDLVLEPASALQSQGGGNGGGGGLPIVGDLLDTLTSAAP